MLLGHFRFDAFDKPHHLVLPLARVPFAFVADLVEDVVQVVHRVDDLADVGFLKRENLGHLERVDLDAPAVSIGIAVDAVDVVVL